MFQQLARHIRPAGVQQNSPAQTGRDRQGPAAAALGLAAILILLALLAAAMFFADRAAKEERRVGMITDALWVEQALRFATRSTEDVLVRLAADIRMGEPVVAASLQIEQIMRLRPELVRVALLRADGVSLLSLPGPDERRPSEILRQSPIDAALKTGERLFGNAYLQPGATARFDLVIPAYAPGGTPLVLVASFSLSELLNAHIPWWVAQKNHVEIRDSSNTAIAAKSRIDIGLGEDGHSMPFDPPGHGLTFQVTPYDTGSGTALRALVALIVLFSGIAAASLFAMLRNIRRRQKAEEALRAESAFRKSMEDSLAVGMRARDHTGRIIYANQAFCDMVGFSREELEKASPPMPYWNRDDLTKTKEIHDEVLAGRAPAEGFEIRFQRRNGELFDALVFEAPLLDADGKSLGWMASILDITDRKQMAEKSKAQADQLARTARLVNMGEMASTLAHEINQPLTAVSNYASGLSARMQSGRLAKAEIAGVLDKIAAQAQRAGKIVRHLRDFTRRNQPKYETVSMNDLVMRILEVSAPDLDHSGIRSVMRPAEASACVDGDPVLIEQVLLNLVRNGAEAMAALPRDQRQLTVCVETEGDNVVVAVSDTGPGLSETMRENLFVPFVSSKPEGMGMGLNICRSIVELHRGRIWHEPSEAGCTFKFSMPESRK